MANKTEKVITVDGKELKLVYPTIGLSSEADTEYSKAFTKALQNGLSPQVVMERTLREAGVWTLEDDAKLEALTRDLQEHVSKIVLIKDTAERETKKIDFYKTQNELYQLTVKRQSLNNHSAEQKGEEAKIAFLSWNCILNSDGTKYWPNQEAFYKEQNNDFMKTVIQEFVSFTSGLEDKMNSIDDILSGKFGEPEIEESVTESPSEVQEIKEEAVAAS